MPTPEITRLATYIILTLAGAVTLVFGILRNDWELIGLGVALLGGNVLAGANVPRVKRGKHADHGDTN